MNKKATLLGADALSLNRMTPPARSGGRMYTHGGRACLFHLPGPQAGLAKDTAAAANLHAFLVHGATPPPHPQPTQISSLDGHGAPLGFLVTSQEP